MRLTDPTPNPPLLTADRRRSHSLITYRRPNPSFAPIFTSDRRPSPSLPWDSRDRSPSLPCFKWMYIS